MEITSDKLRAHEVHYFVVACASCSEAHEDGIEREAIRSAQMEGFVLRDGQNFCRDCKEAK
jgi:hypothetical protein